jgi:glycosyltransferase involved in cell wall biosynthesis
MERTPDHDSSAPSASLTISVIIPVFNDPQMLSRCLTAVTASNYRALETIVVDDGSSERIQLVTDTFDVPLIRIGPGPLGPAHARNVGAAAAGGDILLFVDADVLIRADTIGKIADTFANHPGVSAVFGSYDDEPATHDFVSQFKNLFHHFVHQQANADAETFWSGCGAVRRDVFIASGGFDGARYSRPSIEDIELGYRLRAAGHRILLNKEIQVKHLKRWTLRALVRTDIFDRGVPWTMLILERRRLPNDLNLHMMQRLSAMLAYSMLLYVALVAFFHNIVMLPLIAALFLTVVGGMNWSDEAPLFSIVGRRTEILSYGLIAVIAGMAVASDSPRVVPPLGLLCIGMVASRWVPATRLVGRRFFFPIVLGALAACTVILLSRFSFQIVAPLLAAAGLIVLLNYRLYVFFARRRGLTFALSALPMHLFYYSYTLVGLALGAIEFLTTSRRSRVPAGAA